MLEKYYKLGFRKVNANIIEITYYKISEVHPCKRMYTTYEEARKIQNDNIGTLEVIEEE